jgi:hypothetical protein
MLHTPEALALVTGILSNGLLKPAVAVVVGCGRFRAATGAALRVMAIALIVALAASSQPG